LRENGITLEPDHKFFADRRRVKNSAELGGIRKAQKAAEAAMGVARDLIFRAEPSNGEVKVDGETLTSERLKAEIRRVFSEHGVSGDDFIVSHGAQTAIGHELGHGAIAANEPIVIDLWPRDPDSACYADMTRTYVVGEAPAELVMYHGLVKEALDRSFAATKAGVAGFEVYTLVCELFEEHGQKTTLSKAPGECTRRPRSAGEARATSLPATSSRSSPAFIARASAAAASRTLSWSPRAAPRISPTSPTT
jgi:Xaa-Pro aminopeptidase